MRFSSSEAVGSAEVGMIELLICLKALVVSQIRTGLLLDPKESMIGPPSQKRQAGADHHAILPDI